MTGVSNEDCGQYLSQFDKIDRCCRRCAYRLREELEVGLVFRNKRQNGPRIDVVGELDRDRSAGLDPK